MSENTEVLYVEIDPELKRLLDADERTQREIVQVALWREFGGRRQNEIDMRIEHLERRLEINEAEDEDLAEERRQLKEQKQALESKKIDIEEQDERRKEALDAILDHVQREGGRMFVGHGRVGDAAEELGLTELECIELLKERSVEREMGLRAGHFKSGIEVRNLRTTEMVKHELEGGE